MIKLEKLICYLVQNRKVTPSGHQLEAQDLARPAGPRPCVRVKGSRETAHPTVLRTSQVVIVLNMTFIHQMTSIIGNPQRCVLKPDCSPPALSGSPECGHTFRTLALRTAQEPGVPPPP